MTVKQTRQEDSQGAETRAPIHGTGPVVELDAVPARRYWHRAYHSGVFLDANPLAVYPGAPPWEPRVSGHHSTATTQAGVDHHRVRHAAYHAQPVGSAAGSVMFRPQRLLDARIPEYLEAGARLEQLDLPGIGGLAAYIELHSEPARRPPVSQNRVEVDWHRRHITAELFDIVEVPEVDGNRILVHLHAKPARLAMEELRDIGLVGDRFEERIGLIPALDGKCKGGGFDEEQGQNGSRKAPQPGRPAPGPPVKQGRQGHGDGADDPGRVSGGRAVKHGQRAVDGEDGDRKAG